MINIRFFAILRERLGVDSLAYEYSDEKTVDDIKQNIIARGEPWTLLAEQDVLIALNQTLTSASARVNDGDEIAFFPPVTGGQRQRLFTLQYNRLDGFSKLVRSVKPDDMEKLMILKRMRNSGQPGMVKLQGYLATIQQGQTA